MNGEQSRIRERTFRIASELRVRAQDARATRPEAGYFEVDITSAHAVAVGELPPIHGDPFDRMLVAQARVEGFTLLTSDKRVAEYGPPSRLV